MKNAEEHRPPELPDLMCRYSALVQRTVACYLENPEDIQECVNDTFSDFYLNSGRYDPDRGSCAAFLTSIARHKAIDRYRKNRKLTYGLFAPSDLSIYPDCSAAGGGMCQCAEIDRLPDPEDMAEKTAALLDLAESLCALKPEESELIRMKYFEGMSLKEISEFLGLPYETVKKRHQRSLARLRSLNARI